MSYDNQQLPNPGELPSISQGQGDGGDIQQSATNNMTAQTGLTGGSLPGDPSGLLSAQQSPGQSSFAQPSQQPQNGSTDSSAQQSGLSSNSPAIADDIDLIEKEWVIKAKEIVEKTRDNPYLQNKAISEMKEDYIKKRYNKDLTKSE